MVLVGGFSSTGISDQVSATALPTQYRGVAPCTGAKEEAGTEAAEAVAEVAGVVPGGWQTLRQTAPVGGRFGLSLCSVSLPVLGQLAVNKKYAPVFSHKAKEAVRGMQAQVQTQGQRRLAAEAEMEAGKQPASDEAATPVPPTLSTTSVPPTPYTPPTPAASSACAFLLFGGVCMEQDYGDLWLLIA
ncbi:hypothetical protein B484DRAFT_406736 [Ochromonadaceae sp. CCMP2298]|nr:hypothetical protein B484DRAFT_406736 [Ochromonadaceae sp. CCMP2298]